jgi:hypothetical protein
LGQKAERGRISFINLGLIWIVMHSDRGRGYNWLSSSPSDVKISIMDFFRMTDVLRDERFSPSGLMKMKTLYETTMMSLSMCIGLSVVPSLAFSYAFSSRVRKSHSGYRYRSRNNPDTSGH